MNQPLKLNLQSTMKDVDVLMGMLFTQKQDSAFTVFDNLTDTQILATLKNKNIGFNKTSTALVLVVNYDGTLYKKTIVDTVTPTPSGVVGLPDYTTGSSVLTTNVQQTDINMWLYINWYDQDDATGATVKVGTTNTPTLEVFKATINGANNTQTDWIFIQKDYYYQYSGSGMQTMTKYACIGE